MTTNTDPSPLAANAAQVLHARKAQLHALLQAAASAAIHAGDDSEKALDFKEAAGLVTEGALQDTTTDQALHELAGIELALQRIREGRYGTCDACGEPIAPQRLQAAPASTLCTACQAARERLAAQRA